MKVKMQMVFCTLVLAFLTACDLHVQSEIKTTPKPNPPANKSIVPVPTMTPIPDTSLDSEAPLLPDKLTVESLAKLSAALDKKILESIGENQVATTEQWIRVKQQYNDTIQAEKRLLSKVVVVKVSPDDEKLKRVIEEEVFVQKEMQELAKRVRKYLTDSSKYTQLNMNRRIDLLDRAQTIHLSMDPLSFDWQLKKEFEDRTSALLAVTPCYNTEGFFITSDIRQ